MKKSIYFACSIRGGRADADFYVKIGAMVKPHAKLLTENFLDPELTTWGEPGSVRSIRKKEMGWLEKADAVIAEVTNPSLGVGFAIAKAEQLKKPTLLFYRRQEGKRLSALIAGSPHVQLMVYENVDELEDPIREFIELTEATIKSN
jgi:hypothetical protein